MKLTVLVALSFLMTIIGVTSCQTTLPPITADATSDIYFQRAQSASDLDHFNDALAIYELFLQRHPQPEVVDAFSVRYEIALLHKKLGKTKLSLEEFQGILADYNDATKSTGAPAWVRILSDKLAIELKAEMASTADQTTSSN